MYADNILISYWSVVGCTEWDRSAVQLLYCCNKH